MKAAAEAGVSSSLCFEDSWDLFAASQGADLALIATTADSHRKLVIQAAEAGVRAVLCEKPMATSVADCEEMITACESAGTRLAVNHQMRFMDQYSDIDRELGSGRLGSLASMNVVAGCFGLSMNGSHYCEALRWLCKSDIVSASAWFTSEVLSNPRGAQFVDNAGEMRFETDDGRRLMMSIGADQGHGMTVTYATTYGHIFVDELEGVYYVTARKSEHQGISTTRYGLPWDRWEVQFPQANNVEPTQAVIEALLNGNNYPDGRGGHNIVSALAAAWCSAEQGSRPVQLHDLGKYETRRFSWA